MDVPRCIEELNGRPGKDWNEDENARMIDWWCERGKLKLVFVSAARYLGHGATPQDVEDAVCQFYLDFDRVRRSYRPDDGLRFCTYLLNVCFRNYCIAQGEKIRKRRNIEISLNQQTNEGVEFQLEIEDIGARGDPHRQAQSQAFLDDLSSLLNGPLLPERHKEVFILRHLECMSYEEIAAKMRVSVGSVKGWLSRATRTVRASLIERGWSQWQSEN